MSDRDAVELAKDHLGWHVSHVETCCVLARALLKERETIDSWKREEVLRDEREAGKDAEIAVLKASFTAAESERIEWVQRGERAEAENEALKARLAEAEDECRRWQKIFADALKGGKP